MTIPYLIYDTPTLLVCSITCYSWYIVPLPHLHSHTTDKKGISRENGGYRWPRSLPGLCELGLLRLVKRLRIRWEFYSFALRKLGRSTLHYIFHTYKRPGAWNNGHPTLALVIIIWARQERGECVPMHRDFAVRFAPGIESCYDGILRSSLFSKISIDSNCNCQSFIERHLECTTFIRDPRLVPRGPYLPGDVLR